MPNPSYTDRSGKLYTETCSGCGASFQDVPCWNNDAQVEVQDGFENFITLHLNGLCEECSEKDDDSLDDEDDELDAEDDESPKHISKEVAEKFVKDPDSIPLDEYNCIDDEAAKILADHQ